MSAAPQGWDVELGPPEPSEVWVARGWGASRLSSGRLGFQTTALLAPFARAEPNGWAERTDTQPLHLPLSLPVLFFPFLFAFLLSHVSDLPGKRPVFPRHLAGWNLAFRESWASSSEPRFFSADSVFRC